MAPADSTTHTNKSGKHGKPDLAATTGAAIEWQEATAKTGDREGLRGSDVIAAFVKHLPNSPGVYRMFNTSGDVLYVGKAKSLKKRVAAYSKLAGHGNRIARMIAETSTMEFVRTRTETEALLLEANLIKRLRPRFNVLLRDDKSFPYIVITDDHEAPGVFKHRGARNKAREYYGPFASAGAVTRTINAMQRVFLLRTCSDSVYESRTRPCLLYQIKRCSAPCTGEVSLSEYEALVSDAKAFLTGRSSRIQETLSRQMQKAADDLDFERAAIYRDRISALSMVQGHQGINPHGLDEADVFAIVEKEGQTCVQVFFFRTGQNWGNRAYFPKADKALDCAEILQAFLAQFYDDKPVPREVLLSHDVAERELLADALTLKAGHRVAIGVPRRGKKVDLVRHAELNAREALERRLAESSTQRKLLEGMAEAFNLGTVPQRIEVYDNSHIMGTSAVGAMIVAGPEGFAKNQYRKFNIKQKDLVPGDDYGMMREVLQRRFSRLLKESAKRASKDGLPDEDDAVMGPWPDVILIDGGQGQLNAVMEVLRELEIEDEVEVAAIAKGPDRDAGREKFFVPGRSSFMLPERDPVLYFVQRLRDEAHRFAIGSHRARRKKTMAANPLDEITGIGPARKRALLHRFGSAKAVSRAALRDLKSVEGISDEMAQAIYDHFHEKG